eukprot:s1442_g3.t1
MEDSKEFEAGMNHQRSLALRPWALDHAVEPLQMRCHVATKAKVDTFWSTLADAMVAMVAWNCQNFAEVDRIDYSCCYLQTSNSKQNIQKETPRCQHVDPTVACTTMEGSNSLRLTLDYPALGDSTMG